MRSRMFGQRNRKVSRKRRGGTSSETSHMETGDLLEYKKKKAAALARDALARDAMAREVSARDAILEQSILDMEEGYNPRTNAAERYEANLAREIDNMEKGKNGEKGGKRKRSRKTKKIRGGKKSKRRR
jgi:hypothetical protein